ncbi:chemotaxis response regulator protein-glutamate methylesterase [uncultured Abyssibacter sp.]|uniref:protein-glutamate methylesterase/protein-glutamine glutaminase n=1 Tax=uncultured Abyssibacter sp. TaxID=2320202 RepID=UPI0032B2C771
MATINVMVIDDSAIVRQTLKMLLDAEPDIEVTDVAQDPIVAAQKLRKSIPDVILLDIEMPRMDGLTFLEKLMSQHPIPVVVCSSLTAKGSESAFAAMELGAIEVIEKPKVDTREHLTESRKLIADTIRAAAKATPRKRRTRCPVEKKLNADAVIRQRELPNAALVESTEKIIVIGASTGGTEAVREVLEGMPIDCPGILVVQHMPERFTSAFASRLNKSCKIRVAEARDGQSVLRGHALIAPGGRHLLLKRSGARYYVQVKDGPLVSRHRPSVNVLFRSAAMYGGSNVVAAILTGMGDDGADGMKELFDAGAITLAQDEASCVVYGMPKEAVKRGGVQQVLPLERIASTLVRSAASPRGSERLVEAAV